MSKRLIKVGWVSSEPHLHTLMWYDDDSIDIVRGMGDATVETVTCAKTRKHYKDNGHWIDWEKI